MPSYQGQLAPAPDAPARLGRYELLGKLATGGMSEIHLARLAGEAGFEKLVVVKRLLPELVASPTYVAMFLDEGKLVARLDHPNICEVHELGREGADYYLAMPYLDGVAVHELIARPRDPDRTAQLRVAAGVIAQACAGLHHAHELLANDGAPAHLVHRDVSPSNLFATAAGVIKVLDFGIAKVRGAAATEVGMIKGKQQYMAPEQLLGDPVDRRCDIFALGIVLYELATHQRLFKRPSDYLSARAILEESIPRADAADPAVPVALADVIAKALSRAPADRYATARELGDAVAAALPPASQQEIAAMVTASDELSAQRTRQQRVVGEARTWSAQHAAALADASQRSDAPSSRSDPSSQPAESAIDTDIKTIPRAADIAPTVVARAPTAPRRWPVPLLVGVVIALVIIVLLLARRDDDASTATSAASAKPDPTSHPTSGPKSDPTSPEPKPESTGPVIKTPIKATVTPKPAGQFSIDSMPYATIFLDDVRLGITPIVKHPTPAGRHKLRAVLKDGRSRDLPLDVPAGKLAAPIQLTW